MLISKTFPIESEDIPKIAEGRFVKNTGWTPYYLSCSARKSAKSENAAGYSGIGTSAFPREDWVNLAAGSRRL